MNYLTARRSGNGLGFYATFAPVAAPAEEGGFDGVVARQEMQMALAETVASLQPVGDLVRAAGEMTTRPESYPDQVHAAVIEVLERPNTVSIHASELRMADTVAAGTLAIAIDTAVSLKAANSVEKMLSHQAG